MSIRLYVGSVACDTPRADAEEYGYGLCGFEFNDDFSKAKGLVVRGQVLNPAYLWEKDNVLYSGCEFTDSAYFAAHRIDSGDGHLEFINSVEVDGGGLCMINGSGNTVLGAEFWSGNLLSCSIAEDGSLGKLESYIHHEGHSVVLPRQECSHVHSVYPSPDGRFAIACDLGIDKLVIYKINEDSSLTPNPDCKSVAVPAGNGPRHFAFHPNGKFAYLITEMTDEVITFSYDGEKGVLQLLSKISGLPDDFCGATMAADIRVSADGRFLYTTHRKCNIISVYKIDPDSGIPERIAGFDAFGDGPRSIALSPDGTKLAIANRDGNTVDICEVNKESGMLGKLIWEGVVMEPCCVLWKEI